MTRFKPRLDLIISTIVFTGALDIHRGLDIHRLNLPPAELRLVLEWSSIRRQERHLPSAAAASRLLSVL